MSGWNKKITICSKYDIPKTIKIKNIYHFVTLNTIERFLNKTN